MTKYIDESSVQKRIELPSGQCVILLDRLAKESVYGRIECARNIFLVNRAAEIVWQVRTDFDNDGWPFTNIMMGKNGVKCYRWDGWIYNINLNDGIGAPVLFAK